MNFVPNGEKIGEKFLRESKVNVDVFVLLSYLDKLSDLCFEMNVWQLNNNEVAHICVRDFEHG